MTQPAQDDPELIDDPNAGGSSDDRLARQVVTAVVVCHDGARWLPEVLTGLATQTRRPQRFVAVDVASSDASVQIVQDSLGVSSVVAVDAGTSLRDAVQAGLDAFGEPPAQAEDAVEWVWLLHDDCAPDPTALQELLIRVTLSPSVWVAGPKVRSWEGDHLLGAGLTIDATGHIDSGLDGDELDQGQRDDVDDVLAVSTAGALIRRDAWDLIGGPDPAWSSYGAEIDFGWRINAAGGRVALAARAVVRHARASVAGLRGPSVSRMDQSTTRRRNGMQVVLANTAGWLVPLLLLRYLVGGLGRAVGLLLVSRAPGAALAELRAVAGVYAAVPLVLTARRQRARTREVSHRELRHLFPRGARRWRSSPLRVGLLTHHRPVRVRLSTSTETGPVSEDAESMALGESAVLRFLTKPATVLFLGLTILAVLAGRQVLGATLYGGRLLPTPAGASELWSSYVAGFHPSGIGSMIPSPPWLAVIAALSSVALGKAWFVVAVLTLGVVPLSALSAFTAARAVTTSVRIRVWVAIGYGLLPAMTGAVSGGRLDVAVAAILLPQVMRAMAVALGPSTGRPRWRAAIGAGLLLALLVAFAPLLWPIALVAAATGIAFAALAAEPASALLARVYAAVAILALPVVVLLPWSAYVFAHPSVAVDGSGLPEFYASVHPPSGVALTLLHAGGPNQPPVWVGVAIIAAAVLGLTRRSRVVAAWLGVVLLVAGVAIAVAMTRDAGVTPGYPATRHWPGLALLVAGAGALLAALVGAVGARPALRAHSFGWRQLAAVVIVVLALASTATVAVGWLVRGTSGPLTSGNPAVLPLFVQSELQVDTSPRALVLRSTGRSVSYALVRRPSGPILGDADVAPRPGSVAAARLSDAVRDLLAQRPGAAGELAPFAITYIVVPDASVARVQAALGRASTLTVIPASGATVWRAGLPTGELMLLSPEAATRALDPATTVAPLGQVLPAKPGSATVQIPPGPPGRIVVLAETTSKRWRASVNGQSLTPRTAYGWAQAFVVPASGGDLQLDRPAGGRDALLWLQLVVLVAALVAIVPVQRVDHSAVTS